MPRPPQTESKSTPNLRAAVKIGVPIAKFPRLPDGVKTTRGSVLIYVPFTVFEHSIERGFQRESQRAAKPVRCASFSMFGPVSEAWSLQREFIV